MITCDKCKREIRGSDRQQIFVCVNPEKLVSGVMVDLCLTCADEREKFLLAAGNERWSSVHRLEPKDKSEMDVEKGGL